MKNNIRDNGGFTLIEVVIAIMVLVIGLLGVGVMQLSSITRNATAYNMTEATNLALNQIEQIMSWDSQDPRLADNTAAGAPINFQRTGILGLITAANNTIGTVNDVADAQVQSDDYTLYYDGTPRLDPVNGQQVGIDLLLYVVWNEGTRLKTVSMNLTKTF